MTFCRAGSAAEMSGSDVLFNYLILLSGPVHHILLLC